jgi:hypothetical protein
MRLCSECRKTPWPYMMALFIAGFTAFLTWLTLSTTGLKPETNGWVTAGVFLTVLGMLMTYMVSCMRRHCGHQDHPAHG